MYCSLKAGRIEVSNTHCCGTAVTLNKRNRLTYNIVQGIKKCYKKKPVKCTVEAQNGRRRRKLSSTEEAPRVRSPYP